MRFQVIVGAAAVVVMGTMVTTGTVSAGKANICVSVNGDTKVQRGDTVCESGASDGAANVAIARAAGVYAIAGNANGDDSGNRATASGDNSFAHAHSGNGNTATASGDNSLAIAENGDGNTAIASADEGVAIVQNGDGNTATASGDDSFALAWNGDGNAATASGDESFALAEGDGSTATAATFGCTAVAGAAQSVTC